MCKKLQTAHHPSKVLGEVNKASSILRDVFNDTFTSIQIDDEELYLQTKDYLQEIAPEKASIVKHYQSKDLPLFEKYNIERQIKTSFGKTVSMSKGAYLIIEHTEALHVVDVNSGNRSNKAHNSRRYCFRSKHDCCCRNCTTIAIYEIWVELLLSILLICKIQKTEKCYTIS